MIALGLTMPQKEYERIAQANGILKQRLKGDKPQIRRIKPVANQPKRGSGISTYEQTINESLAPLDQERCPLRNKSVHSTNSTSGANK